MTKKKLFFHILIFSFFGLFVGLAGVSFSKVFIVKNIECFYEGALLEKKICNPLSGLFGKSLFFTDLENASEFNILSANSNNAETYFVDNIKKELPSTLILNLSTQSPLYRLFYEEKSYLVSSTGQLKQDNPNLGLLNLKLSESSSSNVIDSNFVKEDEHNFFRDLVVSLQKEKFDVSEINIESEFFVEIKIKNKPRIIVEQSDEITYKILQLVVLLEEIDFSTIDSDNIDTTDIKEIDLRYKLPVIRTEFSDPDRHDS